MRNLINGMTSTEKSVWILELVAHASDQKSAIELLEVANAFFSQCSRLDRSFVCDAGAIALVLKCLHRCRQSTDDCVTALTSTLLGKLLFHSSERATQFFHDRGLELVSLLFVLITEQKKSQSKPILIEFLHRLGCMRISLATTRNGQILLAMLQEWIHRSDEVGELASMLISAWTRRRENRAFVAVLPSFVNNILDCVLETRHYTVRYYLAQVVRNLAKQTRDRDKLLKTNGFLQSLELLLTVVHGPTKRIAIGTVEILASDNYCKIQICNHNCASIIKMIAANMESLDCRIESLRVIFRLVERRTATLLIKRCPDLVSVLIRLSLGTTVKHETAAVAAYSLMRLAKYVSVRHKDHPILMTVLLYLTSSVDSTIRIWAALALSEHAKNHISRSNLVRSPFAMKALLTLANDSEKKARNLAIKTMFYISSDLPSIILLIINAELVEAVIKHAMHEIHQNKVPSEVIELILAFTNLKNVHARLAKQYGFVESLAFYGVKSGARGKLGRRALHAVSVLAEFL